MADTQRAKKGDLIVLEAIGNRGIIITTSLKELNVSPYEKIWKLEKGDIIRLDNETPLMVYVIQVYVLELYQGMLVYKILLNNRVYFVSDCDAVIKVL